MTIMLLDEGIDTGPILAQQETRIAADETTKGLTERLFELGSGLLVDTLDLLGARVRSYLQPQNDDDCLLHETAGARGRTHRLEPVG